jgi:outer membrane protein assembly factor BamB
LATPVYYEGRIYLASGKHPEYYNKAGRLVCIDPTKSGDISAELAVDAEGNPLPRRRLQAVDPSNRERAIPNPNSGLVWEFTRQGEDDFLGVMHGCVSAVAAAERLIVAVDLDGCVHCLDADTGRQHWAYDLLAHTLTSPLIVDNRVYVADGDGEVAIFRLSADPSVAMKSVGDAFEPIAVIPMSGEFFCSPIFANGLLYLATKSHLFAIGESDAVEQ